MMRLQGIGMVEGTAAGEIKVGDVLRWNYGGLEKVTAIEFTKSGKTIIATIEYINYSGEVVQSERKMRTNREVNIVASGNTILTGEKSFKIVEEEAAVEEVVEEEAAEEIKTAVHVVSYRFTDNGTYVEVMLFVEDIANNMVLVAQKEAEFDNMQQARPLLEMLKKTGSKIEIVETMAYTG